MNLQEMSYREALREAMREEMQRDPAVWLLGEDIGVYGGSFKVTLGLLDEFGERDTELVGAAAALGLPAWRRTVRIILPQALRTILPSGFNEIISLAKGTAMVYVLAMPELFYTIQMIYNRTQEVIPLLMVGAAWYLAITTVLSAIQYGVERALARSERRSAVNQNRAVRRTRSVTTTPAQEPVHASLS